MLIVLIVHSNIYYQEVHIDIDHFYQNVNDEYDYRIDRIDLNIRHFTRGKKTDSRSQKFIISLLIL